MQKFFLFNNFQWRNRKKDRLMNFHFIYLLSDISPTITESCNKVNKPNDLWCSTPYKIYQSLFTL